MMMTTSLMMLDGMLAVGRHEGTGSWSMTTRTRGVMVLLVMVTTMVGRMVVAVRRRAIMLGRHVLRRGRAGSLAQMMLLGGHVGRSDGRDAVGGIECFILWWWLVPGEKDAVGWGPLLMWG